MASTLEILIWSVESAEEADLESRREQARRDYPVLLARRRNAQPDDGRRMLEILPLIFPAPPVSLVHPDSGAGFPLPVAPAVAEHRLHEARLAAFRDDIAFLDGYERRSTDLAEMEAEIERLKGLERSDGEWRSPESILAREAVEAGDSPRAALLQSRMSQATIDRFKSNDRHTAERENAEKRALNARRELRDLKNSRLRCFQ